MDERSTADRLRAAAWELVRDHGTAAATSRRITDTAGVNLGAITYHFGSKDALVGEAIVEQLRAWTRPLTDALTSDDGDPDGRMSGAVVTVLSMFASRAYEVFAIMRALVTDDRLPGVAEATAAWLAEFRALVSSVTAEQQRAGLVPDSVDPDAMAGVFTAFGLGIIVQAAIDRAAPATGDVVGQFLQLLQRP